MRLRPVARSTWVLALSLLCASLASASDPPLPGLSKVSSIGFADAHAFYDFDGSGAVEQGPDEQLFASSPTGESISASLGGAFGEFTNETTFELSPDRSTLVIHLRGRCRSGSTPLLSDANVRGLRSVFFSLGNPGTYELSGAISGSPPWQDGDFRGFDLHFAEFSFYGWPYPSGERVGISEADANKVGGANSAPISGQGELGPGEYAVDVLCSSLASQTPIDRIADGESQFDLILTVVTTPAPTGDCEDRRLRWVGGRAGAFGDADNWSPKVVPTFVDGQQCDSAVFQGGGSIALDLGAAPAAAGLGPAGGGERRIGRLEINGTQRLRPIGSLLADNLSPWLGERSLEIGGSGRLTLDQGSLRARHVAVGSGGAGELEVLGPGGAFSTLGRFGVGSGGSGSVSIESGAQVTTAETVLGELSSGTATASGAGTIWTTGNIAVGLANAASLDVRDGARIESDEAVIDFGLVGSDRAAAFVTGEDAPGNRSTWHATSLKVGSRGALVVDGGLVDVDGLLEVDEANNSCDRSGGCVLLKSFGQLAAEGVELRGGTLSVGADALLFTTGEIGVGNILDPAVRGTLVVEGPSIFSQLEGASRLVVMGRSSVAFASRSTASLSGPLEIGVMPEPQEATVEIGEGALVQATAAESSVIGAASDAPAGEAVDATGRLRLAGRLDLAGTAHSLVVQRRGVLDANNAVLIQGGAARSANPVVSIQEPGELVNHGRVVGSLTIEGSYAQGEQGVLDAEILVAPAPPAAGPARTGARSIADTTAGAAAKKVAPPPFRPVVVTGNAKLAGRLELQFGNGVAPRAGDQFRILDVAGSVEGGFDAVDVRGLVPGSFAFEPSLAKGGFALTSLTDAAPLPFVNLKAKKAVQERKKKGAKVKVTRTGGDRKAPLVVHYTVGGSAESGVDFAALAGSVTIPAGKKSASIVVLPIADGLVEGPETIEITLAPDDAFAPGKASTVAIELRSKDR